VSIAYYFVENGLVTLCDKTGKPGEERRIGEGESAAYVAWRLAREARAAEAGSDFNRPLHYTHLGLA
jgi:hypothetical protein